METNIFDVDTDKKQSLEAWVNEMLMPITEAIGAVSMQLEALYQELM
jgi:hypothetical protein